MLARRFGPLFLGVAILAGAGEATEEQKAGQILQASGVKGGLVVHLGCGDGRLTAALGAHDGYLVHALDAKAENVAVARKTIRGLGLYGKVSAEQWSGAGLPYVDNLVNLLVAEDRGAVPMAEVLRVLAPGGLAYVKSRGTWEKTVKPRPSQIDEWTHYLHDPSNNAVAQDAVVGPPRHLQWTAGPRYSRHHDHMSSVSAMVSGGGRNFYIFDEATRASILTPPKWFLTARDAMSGVTLWKRPIAEWHSWLWPLKSGPQLLTRRLVAGGDRVYVTLGLNAPLSALDAATGRTLHTYEGTAVTEEILLAQGVLFLVVNPRREPTFTTLDETRDAAARAWPDEGKRRILALRADSGGVLWEKADRILPETLTVGRQGVFYHNGERIVCLDRAGGGRKWAEGPEEAGYQCVWDGGVSVDEHDDDGARGREVAHRGVVARE